ncbi:MAG TPA: hypothetical protein VJQ43_05415, partial [Thermoplasmata archaeon]|nr:hypothetical protein [Thermoplasmata archaeon]
MPPESPPTPAAIDSPLAVLDRLDPDQRRALAYASAIGREFDFSLFVAAIGEDDEALAERVEQLVHLGILRE